MGRIYVLREILLKPPERQLELPAGSGKVEMVLARQAVGTAAGEREIDMAHLLLGKRCKRETGNTNTNTNTNTKSELLLVKEKLTVMKIWHTYY